MSSASSPSENTSAAPAALSAPLAAASSSGAALGSQQREMDTLLERIAAIPSEIAEAVKQSSAAQAKLEALDPSGAQWASFAFNTLMVAQLKKEEQLRDELKRKEERLNDLRAEHERQSLAANACAAPAAGVSRLLDVVRPALAAEHIPGTASDWVGRLLEMGSAADVRNMSMLHHTDAVQLARQVINAIQRRPKTNTKAAMAEQHITFGSPIEGFELQQLYWGVHRTTAVVLKKLNGRRSVQEDLGYTHVEQLGLSEEDMLACRLAPFTLFSREVTPPSSQQVSPLKRIAEHDSDCLPEQQSAFGAGGPVQHTPVKARVPAPAAASPEATASSRALAPWCRMPVFQHTVEIAYVGRPCSSAFISRVIADVSRALLTLHDRGLAHMDVKPSNIFPWRGDFLLGDFGSVRKLGAQVYSTEPFVPKDLAAVGQADDRQLYSVCEAHDWWMLAVTVSDLLAVSEATQVGTGGSGLRSKQPLLKELSGRQDIDGISELISRLSM